MNKLFSTLLLASMIAQLDAMENPILEAPQETDEEFIVRAKEKCEFVAAKRLAKAQEDEDSWWDRVHFESYWHEPALKVEYTPGNAGACTIVVRDNNNRAQLNSTLARVNGLLAQFSSKTKHYNVGHIALSADARLIGFIKNQIAPNRGNQRLLDVLLTEDIISVYEIEAADPAKEIITIQVPDSLTAVAGIFNNQATKIMVFGRDFNKFDGIPTNIKYSTEHHHIFNLDSSAKLQ